MGKVSDARLKVPKRSLRVSGLALVALALLVALPGVASAKATARYYAGTTSQEGGVLDLLLVRSDSGTLKLVDWYVYPILTCDDGTTITNHRYGYGFYPYVRLDGHRLRVVSTDTAVHYWLRGHVLPTSASGSLTFTIPMLTSDGTAQVCRTGKISWTATRQ